mgnify:CR=1 FL=1|jgi:hypothetical protein
MARAFYRGQILTVKDLRVTFRDEIGALFDPFSVTYGIVDITEGFEVLVDNTSSRVPDRASTGNWYAPYTIKADAPLGEYKIIWTIQEVDGGPLKTFENLFHVVADSTLTATQYPDSVASILQKLRIRLGDNDPDRNYRFSPPKSAKEVNNFTTNYGFIWQDYELLAALQESVDDINWYLRNANHGIGSLPAPLRSTAVNGAMVYALQHIVMIWIQDEFGYSLNGISLDLSKSEKYRSMLDTVTEWYRNELENIQANRSHQIVGLRQARFSVGYGYGKGQYTFKGAGAGSWRRRNRA